MAQKYSYATNLSNHKTRRHYIKALSVDTSDQRQWADGDYIPSNNIAPGQNPVMIRLENEELEFISMTWVFVIVTEESAVGSTTEGPIVLKPTGAWR